MKKKIFLTGFVLPTSVVAATCFSCESGNHSEPVINFNLTSESFAFSNSRLISDTGAKYSINVSGDIQEGDYVFLSLADQIKDTIRGSFLKLTPESTYFEVISPSMDFDIVVESLDKRDTSFYDVGFSLQVEIVRSHKAFYKDKVKGFHFFNATPTTKGMFEIETDGSKMKVKSFKNDPIVQKQLALCDTLLIPKGTTEIADYAFSTNDHQTTIPDNISRIYLDSGKMFSSAEPTLQKIGKYSFAYAIFGNNLTLPKSLLSIDDNAFYSSNIKDSIILPEGIIRVGNSAFEGTIGASSISIPKGLIELGDFAFSRMVNLNEVNLQSFDDPTALPTNDWGSFLIASLVGEETVKTVYYNKNFPNESPWLNFFSEHQTDLSKWKFTKVETF